jgi:hypothetical protein
MTDVEEATHRYLLSGLLPSWFVPGIFDWYLHRRTRIEDTAGSKESVILPQSLRLGGTPTLMMTEVGVPMALTLRYEINPLLFTVQWAGAAAHEATALWDVRTAKSCCAVCGRPGRPQKPKEERPIDKFREPDEGFDEHAYRVSRGA